MNGRLTRRVAAQRLAAGLCLGGAAAGLPRAGRTELLADRPLRIATGGVSGVYAALGGAICRLVEPDLVRRRQLCSIVATQGSLGNLRFVRSGITDIGIAQGELVRRAFYGEGAFAVDGANPNLRILFGTVLEKLHVVVNPALPVETTADLAGRRVDIGAPGAGTREVALSMLAAADLTTDAFVAVAGNPGPQRITDFCRRDYDAFAFMAAAPNAVVQDAFASCPARLVGPSAAALARLTDQLDDYDRGIIPAGTYRGQAADVETLQSTAFVVADRQLPDAVAERLTEAAFTGLDELRRLHLAFREIDEVALLAPCPDVPYHPGALAYFARAGITPAACR
jgi:TRAP transporter TAXI family solute receptor